ncbi:hypothetical protein [Dyella ginsengisoli]|uniref:hypothetical protein n=1 Tax=Dyella ginsengisoli TaxID=363848 RepID=UPI00034B7E75|nr:hypothetical protein [Dyella ginsengisoli]
MGFLNPGYDDDYRIANMPGTTDIPAASALDGVAAAIPKGIAGGLAKLSDLSLDAWQTDAGNYLLHSVPFGGLAMDAFTPERRAKLEAATKIVADWGATGQDPRITGSVGRIANQTAEGITIGAAGATIAGPWGAAALLGTTEAHASYKEGLKQGLSPGASADQAALTGLFSAAGALVPMKFGKTALTSILGGSATNLALGATQRGLTAAALEADGFPEQAKQYRIFDGEAMAADAILGGAFGAMGHFTHPDSSRTTNPADVDAALAVSAEDHFNRSAPGIPTDPVTATLHASTMADAIHSLANGELPDVPPEHAQEIVDHSIPDPAQDFAPAIHEAALEDVPGYAEAAANVPRVELPPEPFTPAAAGADAGDVYTHQLAHLVANFGDERTTTDDGREVTFAQLADELQQQQAEASKFAPLYEVAAACAIHHGV